MRRLLIVTALMSEAVPLIDFYHMQKQAKQAHYHLYQSPDAAQEITLLVCGLGADKMHQGLMAYLSTLEADHHATYLNFGIAGALNEPLGSLVWANSISTTPIGLPDGAKSPPYTVHSLAAPGKNYQAGILFDMEAEAWMECIAQNAQQFTPDALFCAKVVSDNQRDHSHKIDKHWVENIVHQNVLELDIAIKKLIKTYQ